jgi:hypothetical protein
VVEILEDALDVAVGICLFEFAGYAEMGFPFDLSDFRLAKRHVLRWQTSVSSFLPGCEGFFRAGGGFEGAIEGAITG